VIAVVGRGTVPAALTPLVGRDEEKDKAVRILDSARLLTLVGPGGVGKTSLALATATALGRRFSDGAWWVDLGAVTDQRLVVGALVSSLSVPQSADEEPEHALLGHLRDQETLLVLDNCEQVAAECARVIEAILRSCPEVRVLVTSREVIGVPGEMVVRLGGLTSRSGAALELFCQRASAAVPGFSLAPDDEDDVVSLCDALDGLPLAIELAAVRVGVLPVGEIAARLRRDLRILKNPSRNASRRHQTLEATLDWSYHLLSPTEQVMLRRLSVFTGSFSLAAAEAVAFRAGIGRDQFIQLLGCLVDKSLVHVAERGPEHRYRLLETIRYFAYERLREAFETSSAHEAHLSFYLQLARKGRDRLDGSDQPQWLEKLELEQDNLRGALSWAHAYDAESMGQLTGAMWPFWYRRGYYAEAREWVERAVAVLDEMTPVTKSETLTAAGVLAFLHCDYGVASERLSAARAICESLDDLPGLARVLQRLGSVAREQGRYGEARSLHQQSRDLYERLGSRTGMAASDDYLGFAAWLQGDFDEAHRRGRSALDFFELSGFRQETAAAYVNLGATCYHRGDSDGAARYLAQAQSIASAIGYREGVAWSLHFLGAIAAGRGDPAAAAQLSEALQTHASLGDRWRIASVLETVAASCLVTAAPDRAAELLGAAAAVRQLAGAPVPPVERAAVDAARAQATAALGPESFSRAWDGGRAAPMEESVARALAMLDELALEAGVVPAGTADVSPSDQAGADAVELASLTEREVEILRLVALGLTNRAIASRLYISPGTAGVHVSNILRKLGLSSRVQAATLAERAGLGTPNG
jgi:predicted ATPase/DNA-binding CsgD family transcriptional regulator